MLNVKSGDLIPWLKFILALAVYAVLTAGIISSQGQRITSLEEQGRRDRDDHRMANQQEREERKIIRDKLDGISESIAQLKAEERVLHRTMRESF